jgi:prophage antirepressor-like protein
MNDPLNGMDDFFNRLHLTVLGTHDDPVFYASEIGDVLGIQNTRQTTANFDDDERISDARRAELNVVTYRVMPDGTRRRNGSIVLLTEIGAYRLITLSRKPIAPLLRRHIFNICRAYRQRAADRRIAEVRAEADRRVAEADRRVAEVRAEADRRHAATVAMYEERLSVERGQVYLDHRENE